LSDDKSHTRKWAIIGIIIAIGITIPSYFLVGDTIIQPTPTAPKAVITPLSAGPYYVGNSIEFSARSSTSDSNITDYEWDFEGEKKTGIVVKHAFQKSGEYKVILKIKDSNDKSASDERFVNVAERPPIPPSDIDNDGVEDSKDNCPNVKNPDQKDSNANDIGDVCESNTVITKTDTKKYGPSPYLSFEDSPFYNFSKDNSDFYLQDFDTGILPIGVIIYPKGSISTSENEYTDSVGGGNSYYSGGSSPSNYVNNISFTFDESKLGWLPTFAGLVLTDHLSPGYPCIIFEAYGSNGVSLGKIGPVIFGDKTTKSSSDEDRFFGVYFDDGIQRITISCDEKLPLEIDHLQYGRLNE